LIEILRNNLVLILTVAFFVIMCIRGYRNGLIKMVTSLVGVAVSLFVARHFMPMLVARMEESKSWATWVQTQVVPKLKAVTVQMVYSAISFLAIFVVTLILIKVLSATLDQLMERSFLGIVNQVFGLVIGGAEALIYVWIFMIIVQVLPHFPVCEEILRQINADGLLSILNENNMLVSFLSGFIK